jgi:hypothetical protein
MSYAIFEEKGGCVMLKSKGRGGSEYENLEIDESSSDI